MAFFKKGDVEKHEVVSPEDNSRLNEMRKTGVVKLDDLTDEEFTEYTDPSNRTHRKETARRRLTNPSVSDIMQSVNTYSVQTNRRINAKL
jgi:hypothetical protein